MILDKSNLCLKSNLYLKMESCISTKLLLNACC
uniref:Uncharacterized protein n=1 Tax=Anguilla anguilla TaxID=7936 RepID=A0A0E9SPH9_ANGAN